MCMYVVVHMDSVHRVALHHSRFSRLDALAHASLLYQSSGFCVFVDVSRHFISQSFSALHLVVPSHCSLEPADDIRLEDLILACTVICTGSLTLLLSAVLV